MLGMYSLLSRTSQAMLDKATFAERYREAQREATVLEVATRPLALLHLGNHAEVAFQLTWKTALLGDIEREMTMPLVHEDGRWAVSWSDALILPELGGGNSLRLEHHIPARANIYDVNGLGLAVEDTAVTLGGSLRFSGTRLVRAAGRRPTGCRSTPPGCATTIY
jgi:penicillin-binding protein 2